MRLALSVVVLGVCVVVLAQGGEKPVDWSALGVYDENGMLKKWKFAYVRRGELAANLEKYVGKLVRFVDELAVVWEYPAEYDMPSFAWEKEAREKEVKRLEPDATGTKQKFKGYHDNQEFSAAAKGGGTDYLRFETAFFTCRLDTGLSIPIEAIRRKYGAVQKGPYAWLFDENGAAKYKKWEEVVRGLNKAKRSGPIPSENDEVSGGEVADEEAKRAFARDWAVRRHPKLVYVYGRVVRVKQFGHVISPEENETMSEEEKEEARKRMIEEGGPQEELIVIEVVWVEPVTDPFKVREIEREDWDFRRYRGDLRPEYPEPPFRIEPKGGR